MKFMSTLGNTWNQKLETQKRINFKFFSASLRTECPLEKYNKSNKWMNQNLFITILQDNVIMNCCTTK